VVFGDWFPNSEDREGTGRSLRHYEPGY